MNILHYWLVTKDVSIDRWENIVSFEMTTKNDPKKWVIKWKKILNINRGNVNLKLLLSNEMASFVNFHIKIDITIDHWNKKRIGKV